MNEQPRAEENPQPLRAVLAAQVERHPLMQIPDLYKLLHQGTFASEHAVADPLRARTLLLEELAVPPEGPEEPLLDRISADGEIVRVHLRPYQRAGLDPERLVEAFLRTARDRRGSPEELRAAWSVATAMAAEGALPFEPAELPKYFEARVIEGLPAIHHSETYRRAYAPSYRVIRAAALVREGRNR